jgi:hypothetical protein
VDPQDGQDAKAGIRDVRIRGSRLLLRALQPGEIEQEWRAMVTADPMVINELPQEAGNGCSATCRSRPPSPRWAPWHRDRGLYRPLARICAAVAVACLGVGAARPAPLVLGLALVVPLSIPWGFAVARRLAAPADSPAHPRS